MASTEAQKRAIVKFEKANVVRVQIKLNKRTDADIIAVMEQQESKQGFIKQCIREHMKRHK